MEIKLADGYVIYPAHVVCGSLRCYKSHPQPHKLGHITRWLCARHGRVNLPREEAQPWWSKLLAHS